MKKLAMLLFLMVLGATLSTVSLVSPAAGSGTGFGFNLVGPQSTKADSGSFAGDTLRTTGSGSFDTSTGSIVAEARSACQETERVRSVWDTGSLEFYGKLEI